MTSLASKPSQSRSSGGGLTGKTRIYIVDDHPLIRDALVELISSEPDMMVCGEAATAEAALAEIATLLPDLAIIDLSLKGSSGLELIKNVRALDRRIGIMVVSMHSESTHGLRTLHAGARGYLMKQNAPETIARAIRFIQGGGVFVSSELAAQVVKGFRMHGRSDNATPVSGLSDRELEVVELIGRGNTTSEIAAKLHVSVKTVETHRAHIKEKLQLENSVQLVHFCVRWIHENRDHGAAAG